MPAQLRYQLDRECDSPAAGLRFRCLWHQAAPVWLRGRLDDADHARGEVDVLAAEPDQFASAKTAKSREQHQRPVANGDRIGDGAYDRQRNDLTLGGFFLASTVDPARIASDEMVIDRGFENRMQEPVRLGDRDRTELARGNAASLTKPDLPDHASNL